MKKRGIMLIGYIFISLAMLMIGGSNILSAVEFKGQSVFIYLGLSIFGLSAGMISIPALPEMLDVFEEDAELRA